MSTEEHSTRKRASHHPPPTAYHDRKRLTVLVVLAVIVIILLWLWTLPFNWGHREGDTAAGPMEFFSKIGSELSTTTEVADTAKTFSEQIQQ